MKEEDVCVIGLHIVVNMYVYFEIVATENTE